MRQWSPLLCMLLVIGCAHGHKKDLSAKELADADLRSGPDGKRSGAQALPVNHAHTDEVSFRGQDRTDWYSTILRGHPGVLTLEIHWDNDQSDIMIDVFDEFGAQVAASPVRGPGEKEKKLLTQIDKVGTFYIRVTAPGRVDGSVYTIEAQWDEPFTKVQQPSAPVLLPLKPPSLEDGPKRPHKPAERAGETIQGRIVSVIREDSGLTLYIDKGSAAGIHVGMNGTVIEGNSGDEPVEGGGLKIIKVIDENRSIARAMLRSIGHNIRVRIELGR